MPVMRDAMPPREAIMELLGRVDRRSSLHEVVAERLAGTRPLRTSSIGLSVVEAIDRYCRRHNESRYSFVTECAVLYVDAITPDGIRQTAVAECEALVEEIKDILIG